MGETALSTLADVFFYAYGVILVAGTAMTLVFLFALVRGRKMLGQWPFYKIVWSMTWMDAIYLAVQLCWEFPQMAANDDGPMIANATPVVQAWYNQPAVAFILDVLNMIPPKGILYFSLLMALNRLAVFVNSPISPIFSKLHGLFRDYVGATTLACWLLIVTLSIYTELLAPPTNFNRTSLKYETTGSAMIDSPFLFGITVFGAYREFGKIRFPNIVLFRSATNSASHSSTTRSRHPDDRKLLFQALIVAFFLQLDNVTRVLNVVYDGNGWIEYLINIMDLITTVINHSVHATIFLLFNPTIRNFLTVPPEIRRRLCCS